MVRENRIKRYETGSIVCGTTGAAAGVGSHISSWPINGTIEKIGVNILNSDAGSIWVYSSGAVNETIFTDLSMASGFQYPKALVVANDGTAINAGSGDRWTNMTVNNHLWFVVSGAGAGSTWFAEVYYK